MTEYSKRNCFQFHFQKVTVTKRGFPLLLMNQTNDPSLPTMSSPSFNNAQLSQPQPGQYAPYYSSLPQSMQSPLNQQQNPPTLPTIINESAPLESDSDQEPHKPKPKGRKKIAISYIHDKSRRHITFSKRKKGLLKKAHELSALTGTEILLLVVSESGLVYTFATQKLEPIITRQEGKGLIQACLDGGRAGRSAEEEEVQEVKSEIKREIRENGGFAEQRDDFEVKGQSEGYQQMQQQQQVVYRQEQQEGDQVCLIIIIL